MIFLISCKKTLNQEELIKDSADQKRKQLNKAKNKMEARLSIGEEGITEFINNRWFINKESTEEKIFSWKSIVSNGVCNMGKDKGCKITILDKIG